jgi:MFS family permease
MIGDLRGKITASIRAYDTAIWIRVLGTALTSVTGFMLRPYLVLYLHGKMDGSVLVPMLIVGLPPLCGLIVNMYGGTLSDRYGRKPIMLVSLWIQSLCMLGYLLADQVWQYALVASLMGLGNALFMPAANAQVADVVPAQERAKVFALLHTALNVGAAAGPLLGLMMFSWHPEVVFFICAMSTLLYSAFVWWKVPETRPDRAASGAAAQLVKGGRAPRFRGIGWKKHKTLYLITLCAFVTNMLYAQVETTFPLHLQSHFDDYRSVLATLLTFNGLVVIALQMWITKRSDPYPAYAVIGIAYALYALVALGYGFAPWLWLLLATEFLFTIGEMLVGPHIQKVISEIAPSDKRGWYFSVFGMNWQLGRAVGPVLGGVVMSLYGGEGMFLALSAAIAASGVMIVGVVRKATFVHKQASSLHGGAGRESVTVEG